MFYRKSQNPNRSLDFYEGGFNKWLRLPAAAVEGIFRRGSRDWNSQSRFLNHALCIEELEDRRLLSANVIIGQPPVEVPQAVIDESVFDAALFAENIRETFQFNTVGFGYAINSDGVVNRYSGGGGSRITAASNGGTRVPFTAASEMTLASVSKTITATAMLHLLDAQNISIDAPISPYLPTAWQQGPGVAPSAGYTGVTFRDLLIHRSGFRRIDFDGSEADRTGPNHDDADLNEQTLESGLQQLVAIGIGQFDFDGSGDIESYEQRDALRSEFSYENANFAMMRVMLPYIWGDIPNIVVDGLAPLSWLPDGVETYVRGDWSDTITPEKIRASIYKYYVISNVFVPMGINGVATEPFGPNQTRNYPYPAGNDPGNAAGDLSLRAGADGWFMDARELGIFLHHITHENTVLSAQTRNLMRDNFLGFGHPDERSYANGLFGTNYGHGGDLSNLNTGIMIYPNDVEAALLINSGFASSLGYQLTELNRDYDQAWTTLTIEGTSESDYFTIRAGTASQSIEVVHNDHSGTAGEKVLGQFEAGKLETLILKGLGGNDFFTVDSLPAGIDVELRGNNGDDEFYIGDGDLDTNIRGVVRSYGNRGVDQVELADQSDLSGNDAYNLLWNTITKTNLQESVSYNTVETVRVYANPQNNDITLVQPVPGTSLSFYGDDGDDNFILTSTSLQSRVSLFGQSGNDDLVLQNSHITSSGSVRLAGETGNDHLTAMNVTGESGTTIRLEGGDNHDVLTLDEVAGGINLNLDGGYNVDSLRVLNSSVTGRVDLIGGFGDDFIRLGGGDISSNLSGNFYVSDQQGEDHLVLEDRNGGGSADSYVFNEGFFVNEPNLVLQNFTKSGFGGAIWYDEISNVTLKGTRQDSTTNIRAIQAPTRLNVNVHNGDDQVRIHAGNAGSTINIKGGNGTDTVRVAPETRDLRNVRSFVNVDGNGGSFDRLYLLDDNATRDRDYFFDDTTLERPLAVDWTFDNLTEVRLLASDRRNELNVEGVAADTELTVFLNGGRDSANISLDSRDLDTNILGDLTIWGGSDGELDGIFFFDSNDQGDDSYDFTPSTFKKSTTGTWSIPQFERVTLEANQHDNTINVPRFGSLYSDQRLTVYGDGGNDTMIVGSGTLRTTFIQDHIFFHGDFGDDRLIVEDTNTGANREYTLTGGEIDLGLANGSVRHTFVEQLEIRGGIRNDTFNLEGNRSFVELTVNGNAGSDSFVIAETARNLADVLGTIRLNGGSTPAGQTNFDQVTIHDRNHAGNGDYTVHRSSAGTATISRVANASIRVGSVQRTTLLAGSGDNTIDINGFVPGNELVVNAGPGSDSINVIPTATVPGVPTGRIRLNGGGGASDILNVIDDVQQNVSPYNITYLNVYRKDDNVMPIRYTNLDALSLAVDRGANLVTVHSTRETTPVSISTGSGNDYIEIPAPSPNVHIDAGSNGSAGDRVQIIGRNAVNHFIVQGETISHGTGAVNTTNVERREIDGRGGRDLITALGVNGTDEAFRLLPNLQLPNGATLSTGIFRPVVSQNVPRFRIFGNNSDNDTFEFVGRGPGARYDINMGAAGSSTSPFMVFTNNSGSNLSVQNFGRVDSARIRGTTYNDVFNIRATNNGSPTGRQISIDGSSPTNTGSGDTINYVYPGSAGSLSHNQQDDDGTIRLEFSRRIHIIDYNDIEEINFLPF